MRGGGGGGVQQSRNSREVHAGRSRGGRAGAPLGAASRRPGADARPWASPLAGALGGDRGQSSLLLRAEPGAVRSSGWLARPGGDAPPCSS